MLETAKNKRFWIIGASTGIGRALAIEAAAQGATLILSARDADKLQELQNILGAQHVIQPLDVTNREAFAELAETVRSSGPLDSVIYMPAQYEPMPLLEMDIVKTEQIIHTNLTSAFYFINAITPMIKNQQIKQIALCGSVAGFCGLPNGQPYSATKAGIINLAESLRAELSKGIDVKLINPGFVRTPMTDKNSFVMPMSIEPEIAAKNILDGLQSKAFEIHFPKRFTWIVKFLAALPYGLYFPIVRRIDQKR